MFFKEYSQIESIKVLQKMFFICYQFTMIERKIFRAPDRGYMNLNQTLLFFFTI